MLSHPFPLRIDGFKRGVSQVGRVGLGSTGKELRACWKERQRRGWPLSHSPYQNKTLDHIQNPRTFIFCWAVDCALPRTTLVLFSYRRVFLCHLSFTLTEPKDTKMASANIKPRFLSYSPPGGSKAEPKAFIRPSDLGARPSRKLSPNRQPGKRDYKPHLFIWSEEKTPKKSQVSKAISAQLWRCKLSNKPLK